MKRFIYCFFSVMLLILAMGTFQSCSFEMKEPKVTETITYEGTETDTDSTSDNKSTLNINLGQANKINNEFFGEDIVSQMLSGVFGGMTKLIIYPIIGFITFIVLVISTIIIALIIRYKNKKSQYNLYAEAIKSGQRIPEDFYLLTERENLQAKGIKNISLGIGLGICFWILIGYPMASIGLIFVFIGIGQVIIHRTQQSSSPNNKKTEE